MNISERGESLLKEYEALRLKAYDDETGEPVDPGDPVHGTLTIGWGHTGDDVRPGMEITEEEAEKLFDGDLDWAERAVNSQVKVSLSQHQFDALVSFTYNVGVGALAESTLLRKLNKGRYGAVPGELARWDKRTVDGKKVQSAGLANRRAKEAAMWSDERPEKRSETPAPVKDKSVSRSKEGQGAGISGIGAIGAAASEGASQIQPLAQYSDILMYAFVALTLVGVGVVIYGKIQEDDD